MKTYRVKGASGGAVRLGKDQYVGGGGEGDVYAKGGVAFKIYHDPTNLIPASKVRELAAVAHPRVVRPDHYVLDDKGREVGVTMPFVDGGEPLAGLFVSARRARLGYADKSIPDVVSRLREIVDAVHRARILIVDLNEYNFLVRDPSAPEVWAIDADAWQTPSHPAQVLMPSVRDWKVKGFDWTELSDWFSFAIVTFQLWTGLHPYKGKHPTVRSFEDRMKQGISVFDSTVKIPRAATPFGVIPGAWMDWYQRLFARGERCLPPGVVGALVAVARQAPSSTATISLDLLIDAGVPLVAAAVAGGHAWLLTRDGVLIGRGRRHRVPDAAMSGGRVVVGVLADGMPVLAQSLPSGTRLWTVGAIGNWAEAPGPHPGGDLDAVHGNLVSLEHGNLTSLGVRRVGRNVRSLPTRLADMAPRASRLHRGCAVQEVFGSTWVALVIGADASVQVRVPELDDYRVVDAKYENRVLVVVGARRSDPDRGRVDRLILRFDPDVAYATHDCQTEEDVGSGASADVAVSGRGVAAVVNADGDLLLMSHRQGSTGARKVVGGGVFTADTELLSDGSDVLLLDRSAGKLYKLGVR